MAMLLISCVSATLTSLGTFKQGDPVTIKQLCSSCSYNNITSIVYPNGTQALNETPMSLIGGEYVYVFNDTSLNGEYRVNGFGDLSGTQTDWDYTFDVTSSGGVWNTQSSIFYMGIMFILFLLFVACVLGIVSLPTDDHRDEEGKLIAINSLKYLRLPLVGVAWGLLVFLSYLAMGVAGAYLTEGFIVSIFQTIFTLLMVSIIIGLPVVFWFIVSGFMQDVVIKKYIARGLM